MNHDIETQSAVAAAAATAATKSMQVGFIGSAIALVTSNEFVAGMGMLLALLGFCVNWYFKRREDKRQQALFELEIAALKQGKDD
jgi:hypothetical protein